MIEFKLVLKRPWCQLYLQFIILFELSMNKQENTKYWQNNLNILQLFDKTHHNYHPLNLSQSVHDKSLNLEQNNSLALMARHSIQNGMQIPGQMLSCCDGDLLLQEDKYQQKQLNQSNVKNEEIEEHLIDSLHLVQLIGQRPDNFTVENTKNMLRNFGNAQNHYIIYNKRARQYVLENISNPKCFDEWVRIQKLQNFENFKTVWGEGNNRLFSRVYRKLCWDFYTQTAIPYVLTSRIKNNQTKTCHLRYIYRFLQGLQNPQQFTCFKKI